MKNSIQINKERTCAFTGHRPEAFTFGDDESAPECTAIKEKLATEIEKIIEKGIDTFISGAAKGVDTWAMEAVLALRETKYPHIKLIAAVPYANQAKSWSTEDKQRYERLTSACNDKVTLSEKYFRGCLQARNRFMVDNSHCLIAVYNGSKNGGTAYTVKYALKLGKDTVIITI